MISFIADITYKYGKKYLLARAIFLFIIMVVAIAEASVSHLLLKITIAYPQFYVVFYVLLFILFFLIPFVKTFLDHDFSNPQVGEPSPISGQNQVFPGLATMAAVDSVNSNQSTAWLFTGNPGFGIMLAKILKTLPPDVSLTQREQEVLEQLYEKQDNDVIGDILGISKNTLKVHLKNLYTKFNIRNRTELYTLMGLKEDILELTKREKEVLKLQHQGKNADQIARELYISNSTARRHIWNIRQKTPPGGPE